jgi:hypothetical protein
MGIESLKQSFSSSLHQRVVLFDVSLMLLANRPLDFHVLDDDDFACAFGEFLSHMQKYKRERDVDVSEIISVLEALRTSLRDNNVASVDIFEFILRSLASRRSLDYESYLTSSRPTSKLTAAAVARLSSPHLNQVQKQQRARPACGLCDIIDASVAFVPCGHVACSECALQAKRCNICDVPIQSQLRLYL